MSMTDGTTQDELGTAKSAKSAEVRRIAAEAKAAARSGDHAQAAQLWRRCHLLGMPKARMRQAACLYRAGQPVKAARIAAGRLGIVPTQEIYDFVEEIGLALTKDGEVETAVRTWAEIGRVEGHGDYAASKVMTLRGKAGGIDERLLAHAAAFLAETKDPIPASARSALTMIWTREGASQRALELCRVAMSRSPAVAAALAADEIGLLAALGREAEIIDRLGAEPELLALASVSPAVASLIVEGRVEVASEAVRADATAVVEAVERMRRERDALWADLADPGLKVAVVGNSGVEIGRGSGPAIDGHDVVIRFNDFSVAPTFAPDYGTRTDVLVRSTQNRVKFIRNVGPETRLVLFGVRFMQLHRNWSLPIELADAGYRVACFPEDAADALMPRLGARPSAGLTVLSLLARLRGGLVNVGCYGFSMIDQIGPEATSSHYFEKARPTRRHNWTEERVIYEELLAGRRG